MIKDVWSCSKAEVSVSCCLLALYRKCQWSVNLVHVDTNCHVREGEIFENWIVQGSFYSLSGVVVADLVKEGFTKWKKTSRSKFIWYAMSVSCTFVQPCLFSAFFNLFLADPPLQKGLSHATSIHIPTRRWQNCLNTKLLPCNGNKIIE